MTSAVVVVVVVLSAGALLFSIMSMIAQQPMSKTSVSSLSSVQIVYAWPFVILGR